MFALERAVLLFALGLAFVVGLVIKLVKGKPSRKEGDLVEQRGTPPRPSTPFQSPSASRPRLQLTSQNSPRVQTSSYMQTPSRAQK